MKFRKWSVSLASQLIFSIYSLFFLSDLTVFKISQKLKILNSRQLVSTNQQNRPRLIFLIKKKNDRLVDSFVNLGPISNTQPSVFCFVLPKHKQSGGDWQLESTTWIHGATLHVGVFGSWIRRDEERWDRVILLFAAFDWESTISVKDEHHGIWNKLI
jgi:hypothetical protein